MWRRFIILLGTGVSSVLFFWNLENFFDPFDDPVTLDDEFTARGEKHWNWKRFTHKANGIAKTILAASDYGGAPPDICAFAEVENRFVLRRLKDSTPLEKLDYEIIHRDSPDPRGIDVALLYRKSRFKPLRVEAMRVSEEFDTRDILYVKGVLGADTVHIFVNHWPSKRGGAAVSGPKRAAAAARLSAACDSIRTACDSIRNACDSIRAASPRQQIIALGDFNDTPENVSLPLHNLAAPLAARGEGTLKYRGNWEMIDQCFVSDTSGCTMHIFKPLFLVEPDPAFTGDKPRRTYVGPRHNGGLSDHLPIVLKIE